MEYPNSVLLMGSFALNNLHSMSRNILLIVFLSLTTVVHAQLWRCVNPLIGSKGEGRVFVGPSVPFGMVKARSRLSVHA